MPESTQLAVYYFPNYHVDARNVQQHGPGWTEWELVRAARPRWPGHALPNVPLWGYTDEAKPADMAQKITAAADHGIDAFIFDWYWYNDGPFLQRGLDEGYLHAPNRHRVKFALMWANHDWRDIHPKKLHSNPPLLYPGAVTPKTFEAATNHVIERYFTLPCYWQVNGRPYFSIYDLPKLIASLGGIEQTAAALRGFRERTRKGAGVDLHLNLVYWSRGILKGENPMEITPEVVRSLGFDSITSYVWIHHMAVKPFPAMPYRDALEKMKAYTAKAAADFAPTPYYPNVTMGWDASPRTVQTDPFVDVGYPFMGTLGDNTPENFCQALKAFEAILASRPEKERILTINAWNEWTEGSYLEPDTRNGMGYLEAIKETFGTAADRPV